MRHGGGDGARALLTPPPYLCDTAVATAHSDSEAVLGTVATSAPSTPPPSMPAPAAATAHARP